MSKPDSTALTTLHTILKPGDTLTTMLTNRSSDGMSRRIAVLMPALDSFGKPYIRNVTALAARAGGFRVSKVDESIIMGGWGMDFGFSLVYSLSSTMFASGFNCIGNDCPSNDHVNDWQRARTADWHHSDGGYALQQQWV